MSEFLQSLSVFAQTTAEPATTAPGPDPKQFIFIIAAMGAAFYFLILRPQGKERKQRQTQLDALCKGDRVVTIGGIHGLVTKLGKEGKTAELELAKNMKITINKSAVASITKKGKGGEDEG